MLNIGNYIGPVLGEVDRNWKILYGLFPELHTKLYSELVSNLLETAFRHVVPNCYPGVSDNDADLYIDGEPLEIKTCANNRVWRGGNLSKRPGLYLLVGYTFQHGEISFFVLQTELTEAEWIPNETGKYYATTSTLDHALSKPETKILWGGTVFKRTCTHPVYVGV